LSNPTIISKDEIVNLKFHKLNVGVGTSFLQITEQDKVGCIAYNWYSGMCTLVVLTATARGHD
jgi:hypothetical protein